MATSSLDFSTSDPAPPALQFRGLKIAYTWKCNAVCEHCAVCAGPRRQETLDLELALECIDTAAALGLESIELTGGEVFLFYGDLLTLVDRIHARALKPIVVTNAFWAKTRELASKRLEPLRARGLRHLIFSTDRYHQAFIPLDRVIHAIEAARELGISSSVTVCCLENDPAVLETIAALHPHTSKIHVQNVSPSGRATALPRNRMSRRPLSIVGRPCHGTACPAISPEGRVTLCCAPPMQMPVEAALHSPLVLGWLDRQPLAEILELAREDVLLQLLAAEGVTGVLKKLDSLAPEAYAPRPGGYFGSCDLCMEILGHQPTISRARRHLPAATAAPQSR
jgi:pyruvate-formate lyase-activating enzyme